MSAGAAWWLAAVCVLATCAGAVADHKVTWPGCAITGSLTPQDVVVQPGQTDPSITDVQFYLCKFTSTDLKSLKYYPNLRNLYLNEVNIRDITALDIFEPLTYLRELTMAYSSIEGKNLPSNSFRNCHSLSYIDFEGNDMRNTPADLLQGLDLNKLLLRNCSLQEVPSFFTSQTFPHLSAFFASHNEITGIGPSTFANAVNLSAINLSRNRLQYLDANSLKPLTKLKNIWLDSNMLKYIPEALFQYKPSLETIALSYNQIENIPLNAFLGTPGLKTLYLDNNRLTHLPQNFISNLHAIGVSFDYFSFYSNPWECQHLNEILVALKKFQLGYYAGRFNGRELTCTIGSSGQLVTV